MVHAFDNADAGWQFSGTYGATLFEVGTKVVVATDGYLEDLRWYRHATGATAGVNGIRLWDATTHTLRYTAPSVPDNGAVGWQVAPVASSVALVAGHTYIASIQTKTGTVTAFQPASAGGNPPVPLAFADGQRYYHNPNGNGEPDTVLTENLRVAADFGWSVTAPDAGPPATTSDIGNALAAWLSTTDGTHADSAPLQDHATLVTVNTNTAAVKADAEDWAFGLGAAAHGYYADVKTLIGNIKTVTDALPTPIAQLTSIVLDHYTADIALILAQIDTALSNLGAQSTDLSGTAGSAVGALSGRTGFPATGWTMSAEADFEDAIAFVQPADAYVLSITSYQDTQPANESPAGLWLPRLGWWCVLNGTLATQRQFVDFQEMLLDAGGRRMPGCAIQLRPGTLATVQAWLLA